jgi:hypothetical protein
MSKFFDTFIPASATPLMQARAKVVVAACFATGAALVALILYWIIFSWLEQVETVFMGLVLVLILAGILALVRRGYVHAAAWILTVLMALLNLANMLDYGISTTASAGFLIVIVLAALTLGPALGLGSAVLGSLAAFAFALAASAGQIQTQIPFEEATLSFDAPTLTIIYLLVGLLCAVWSKTTNEAFAK